jgi:uncharacterized protein YcgI (DUF1989 family)
MAAPGLGEGVCAMERIVVPASEGRGVRLRAGQRYRVVDLEGGQIGDMFAFKADDVSEYAAAEHTRVYNGRLFPKVGEHFVTNRRRPILLFEADTSPGIHDMMIAACDPTRYRELGVQGWHPSCQENLQKALAALGVGRTEIPQPINVFQNTPALANGEIDYRFAETKAGDYAQFRTEMDCYVVVTACAQDLMPVNGTGPTPMAIDVLD